MNLSVFMCISYVIFALVWPVAVVSATPSGNIRGDQSAFREMVRSERFWPVDPVTLPFDALKQSILSESERRKMTCEQCMVEVLKLVSKFDCGLERGRGRGQGERGRIVCRQEVVMTTIATTTTIRVARMLTSKRAVYYHSISKKKPGLNASSNNGWRKHGILCLKSIIPTSG